MIPWLKWILGDDDAIGYHGSWDIITLMDTGGW